LLFPVYYFSLIPWYFLFVVEGGEAHPVDASHQQEVELFSCKASIDGGLLCVSQRSGVDRLSG
jgi:hypothetical protein